MSTSIVTVSQKSQRAQDFIGSFSSNTYYLFLGNHAPSGNALLQDINDDLDDTVVNVYRNMIQGKVVTSDEVCLSIRNIPYVANTVYDMYDNSDPNLSEKDFYVVVNEESFFHIYKCLDNNFGSVSTAQPTFSHISGGNNAIYQTSDGYRWKYMYSVDLSTYQAFSSTYYIPLVPNTAVQAEAAYGSIDIITVETVGRKYDNYITGSFKSNDIRVNGNTKLYAISNTIASTVNGFYTGCLLYISSGAGVGENRVISDYISNENGNFIVLDNTLTSPLNGSQYEIYPRIDVKSVNQSVPVIGRALVNALASNSIYRVELLNRGSGYDSQYVTATVVANNAVGITQVAQLKVIYSPPLGHGSDPADELYANAVAVSLTVSNTEGGLLLATNQFQQLGLIYNPTFNNVVFTTSLTNGAFQTNETFYNFRKIKIADNVSINTTSTLVNCATAKFTEQVNLNEMLFIQDDAGAQQQLITVATINSNTVINCVSNGSFASSSCHLYKIQINSSGIISSVIDPTHFSGSNCTPLFAPNTQIMGLNSGKLASINTIVRNDVTKDFSTFIQLNKYSGLTVSGSFLQNEVISQGNTTAVLFDTVVNGANVTIYASNQSGLFTTSGSIIGQTSGAVATITKQYAPEISYGVGDIIYIQNIFPVARKPTENEKFQMFFEF